MGQTVLFLPKLFLSHSVTHFFPSFSQFIRTAEEEETKWTDGRAPDGRLIRPDDILGSGESVVLKSLFDI